MGIIYRHYQGRTHVEAITINGGSSPIKWSCDGLHVHIMLDRYEVVLTAAEFRDGIRLFENQNKSNNTPVKSESIFWN